jgi:hypothetical protein
MGGTNNRIQIVVAVIGVAGLLAAAIIQWHPWTESSGVSLKKPAHKVLAGTVIEEGSNKSIELAEITIVGRNEQYYTEGNGNFRIQIAGDSIESVRIRVSKLNYHTFDMSYDIPNETVIIPLVKEK